MAGAESQMPEKEEVRLITVRSGVWDQKDVKNEG
jgi:hypothetical protein